MGITALLAELSNLWVPLAIKQPNGTTPDVVDAFEAKTGFSLPTDIQRYFIELDGTCGSYDDNFFRFNGLADFKSIEAELCYWGGIPDYTGIVYTLPGYQDCFVLADWSIQCITFAIRLHKKAEGANEIYAICGDVYQVVAPSFTDFISTYLANWQDVLI